MMLKTLFSSDDETVWTIRFVLTLLVTFCILGFWKFLEIGLWIWKLIFA